MIPPTSTQPIYGSCMSLTFCPICSFRESVKAESDPLIKSDKEKARWKNNKDPELNLNKMEKNERYEKFARIYACCKGGDGPGATAMLLYKFMLGDEGKIKLGEPPRKQVLNIRYVMNVECYNPGFELLKMYGNLEKSKQTDLNTPYKECLQGIVISPVRHENDWWGYSQELMSKVIDSVFYYDGEKEKPNNILIITNDYRDILLKEYIQFEVERNVDDACIQGDIKEPSAEKLKLELYEKFRDLLKNKSLKDKTQQTLTKLVTKELSLAIRGYVKKEKTVEDLKRLINSYFTTVNPSKEQQGCPCPITECPFKSKALYLLIEGKGERGHGVTH